MHQCLQVQTLVAVGQDHRMSWIPHSCRSQDEFLELEGARVICEQELLMIDRRQHGPGYQMTTSVIFELPLGFLKNQLECG